MKKEALYCKKEVEPDFSMSKIDKNFKTFAQMQEELKTATVEKLYPRVCNYNQRATLNGFIKKLNEKFGDKLLIYAKDLVNIKITPSTDREVLKDKELMTYGYKYTLANYLTFAIDGYMYYIQLGSNPFFSDSYITTYKIYKLDGLYVKPEYYGGGYNINNLIEDEYSRNCNIENASQKLFEYFMEEHYRIEGPRYTGRGERLTQYLEDGTSYIITLEEEEKSRG